MSSSGTGGTINKAFCLDRCVCYTICFNWIAYGINFVGAKLQAGVSVGDVDQASYDSPIAQGRIVEAPALGDNRSGQYNFTFQPPVTGTYTFWIRVWWGSISRYPTSTDCSSYANDFAFTAPTVTCARVSNCRS